MKNYADSPEELALYIENTFAHMTDQPVRLTGLRLDIVAESGSIRMEWLRGEQDEHPA